MGILGKRQQDPLVQTVDKLVDQMEKDRLRNDEFTSELLAQIKEQNAMIMSLIGQYVAHGSPMKSSLDDRLEERESRLSEPEWEPFTSNPFKDM